MIDRWYSESVFSVTPLDALVMDARHVAAKGPGVSSTSSSWCNSSSMRVGIVSFSPSISSSISSWRGFSPGCLSKRARMWPENWLGLLGGDIAKKVDGIDRVSTCLNTMCWELGGLGVRPENDSFPKTDRTAHAWSLARKLTQGESKFIYKNSMYEISSNVHDFTNKIK